MPDPAPIQIIDWAQFGLAGVVIAALFVVLVTMYKSHQSERSEWRSEIRDMHRESTRTMDSLEKVTGELTMAVRELVYRTKDNNKSS